MTSIINYISCQFEWRLGKTLWKNLHFICKESEFLSSFLIYNIRALYKCKKIFFIPDGSLRNSILYGMRNVIYYGSIESYCIDKKYSQQLSIETIKAIFAEAKGNFEKRGKIFALSYETKHQYPSESSFVWRVITRKWHENGEDGTVTYQILSRALDESPPDECLKHFIFSLHKEKEINAKLRKIRLSALAIISLITTWRLATITGLPLVKGLARTALPT